MGPFAGRNGKSHKEAPETCHAEEAENLFRRVESPTTFRAKAVPDHNIQACEVFVARFQSVCSFGGKAEVAVANRPFLQYLLELARQPKQQPNFLEVLTRSGKKKTTLLPSLLPCLLSLRLFPEALESRFASYTY